MPKPTKKGSKPVVGDEVINKTHGVGKVTKVVEVKQGDEVVEIYHVRLGNGDTRHFTGEQLN